MAQRQTAPKDDAAAAGLRVGGVHAGVRGRRGQTSLCAAGEVRELFGEAIDHLPPGQREVVILRDVQGWTAPEVCQILQLSDADQRVLLHRGRSKLRRGLAHYLAGE